jgi:hypothetical protein
VKAKPHESHLCGCAGCQHWEAAGRVVRMLKSNWCLGYTILERIAKEASEGDVKQKEMLENIEAQLGDEFRPEDAHCK